MNPIEPLRGKVRLQIPFARCIHELDTALGHGRLFRRPFLRDKVLERAPISRHISARAQSFPRAPERSSQLDTVSGPMHQN